MKHFANITETLNLPKYVPPGNYNLDISDSILNEIEAYRLHPSIVKIKELAKKFRGGGTRKNFDRGACVIFLVLKFDKLLFY